MYTMHCENRNKRKANDIAIGMDVIPKGNTSAVMHKHNTMPDITTMVLTKDNKETEGKGILTVKGV